MSLLHGVHHIVRTLVRRGASDDETREELAFHMARQTEKHIAAGASPADAARLAALELGGVQRWREETTDARRGTALADFANDARYAARGLLHRPGFALAAFATLAIGAGASAAMFGITERTLMRPLPFQDPGRLMSISLRMPVQSAARVVDMVWSYPKFLILRDRQRVFASLALHSVETLVIASDDGSERIPGEMATAEYFDVLGVRPVMGRPFTPEEDRPGGAAAAIIGDAMWHTRFSARHDILGLTIVIGGVRRTIVGVMPAGFLGQSGDARCWVPLSGARSADVLQQAGAHNMELVARVALGVSPAVAQQAVAALGREIDAAYPADDGHWGATAYPLNDLRMHPAIRRALRLLDVAVALVLLMVCVNLTTLLVTRGAARRQEFAIRAAIGAGRSRIVRQLVAECVVLGVLGAAGGLVLAIVATGALAAELPLSVPMSTTADLTRLTFGGVHVDLATFAFAVLLSLAVSVGIGIVSAMLSTRPGIITVLRYGSEPIGRAARRAGLVTAQVALAAVCLVAAGLSLRSLERALAVPLGYDPSGLVMATVTLDPLRATSDSNAVLWETLVAEIRATPGVSNVALATCSPLGAHCDGTSITPNGHSGAAHVMYMNASPGYFNALGIGIVRGRDFTREDAGNHEHVVIINRAAAREVWGADDPLTTPIRNGDDVVRVVGVVSDARFGDVEQPAMPAIYAPYRGSRAIVFVRMARGVDASRVSGTIRRAVRRAGAGHAVGEVRTMSDRLRDAMARNRLSAQVFTAFAASAVLLAAIGVYGTLSLQLTQRSREFAIRRALGAERGSIAAIVGAQAARITAIGGVVGLAAAAVVARGMSSLLFDVRSLEPGVFVGTAVVLIVAIVAATTVPTVRSLAVDPREAMRA